MHLGIDLGGTKIEAAVLDNTGNFRFRQRLPTPCGDYPATLATISELVAQAETMLGHPVSRVGVGHPGSSNPNTGLIRNANSTCLNGQPLKADLIDRLNRPVFLANDADCLVLSETRQGAAENVASVFGVILGTGVGGGWVIHQKLLRGPNGLCGEWGHNPLPTTHPEEVPGPLCYCGKRGCIEAWLSGPALISDYQRHTHDHSLTDVPALVEAAKQQNEAALHALARHTDRLARALASTINAIDPTLIVLGGGVSQRPGLIHDLQQSLPQYLFLPPKTPLETRIVLPSFGDSSGVRGAAFLCEAG